MSGKHYVLGIGAAGKIYVYPAILVIFAGH